MEGEAQHVPADLLLSILSQLLLVLALGDGAPLEDSLSILSQLLPGRVLQGDQEGFAVLLSILSQLLP